MATESSQPRRLEVDTASSHRWSVLEESLRMQNGTLGSRRVSALARTCLVTASLVSTMACVASMDSGGEGGGGGSGSGSGGGGGGGGSGSGSGSGGGSVGGWTALPLIDDTRSDRTVEHAGNDRVTGIAFASPDKGLVVTQEDGLLNPRGGAVFHATRSAITSIAFSGDDVADRPGARHSGSTSFVGLERTPTGYIAMAYASETIASSDDGATFAMRPNGGRERFGIENVLAYQVTATGTTIVRDTGVVSVSDGPPGPDAIYTDIWSPNTDPDLPLDVCQRGPKASNALVTRYAVHVSSDRMFLAYTANPGRHPEICISTDGGASFYPHALEVPESAMGYQPVGVTFTSRMTGIAWFAADAGGAYIKRTTDGGTTWTDVPLPREIASDAIELPAGFFAPDGVHGWLAGFDFTAATALLLATSDGGATWSRVSGVAEAVEAFRGNKLLSGFALDATHVWLGGDHGLVMRN
jgi:hypothetical protein